MTLEIYRVTVEVSDKKITFEGPRQFVEEQVAKITGQPSKHMDANLARMDHLPELQPQLTERELIEAKRPKGHMETVTVLAFALTQAGATEFTEEEMRRAYLRAGVRPPKIVSQALRDAKNRLDYIEYGARKGTYRLSHHGDRTVRFDLPRL
jgi:hypothetical protein